MSAWCLTMADRGKEDRQREETERKEEENDRRERENSKSTTPLTLREEEAAMVETNLQSTNRVLEPKSALFCLLLNHQRN